MRKVLKLSALISSAIIASCATPINTLPVYLSNSSTSSPTSTQTYTPAPMYTNYSPATTTTPAPTNAVTYNSPTSNPTTKPTGIPTNYPSNNGGEQEIDDVEEAAPSVDIDKIKDLISSIGESSNSGQAINTPTPTPTITYNPPTSNPNTGNTSTSPQIINTPTPTPYIPESYEPLVNTNQNTNTVNPAVNVSPASGSRGTLFTFNASGFTPNGKITTYFLDPDVPESHYSSAGTYADRFGNYTNSFTATTSNKTGVHKYWIVDEVTGKKSNVFEYTITETISVNNDRYTIRMLQVDDEATAYINGKTYKTFWGHNGYNNNLTNYVHRPGDSGDIDITQDLKAGTNEIKFELFNKQECCGYALNIEIRKNGTVIYSDSVHQEDSGAGIKYIGSFYVNK